MKNRHTRARIPCTLTIPANGKRFTGNTRSISIGGTHFEAAESLVRPGHAVISGGAAQLSFQVRRGGNFHELKMPCRVAYVTANTAGLEFTGTLPSPSDHAALAHMVETGSNRLD